MSILRMSIGHLTSSSIGKTSNAIGCVKSILYPMIILTITAICGATFAVTILDIRDVSFTISQAMTVTVSI